MATKFQIKKIHTLKNILGLNEDIYREILNSFNAQSSKELNFNAANRLLNQLENKAVSLNRWEKQSKKYESLKRPQHMATASQMRMLESLWRELCYIDSDKFAKTSLRKILKMKLQIDDIMFLTKKQANKAINLVLGMKENLKDAATSL